MTDVREWILDRGLQPPVTFVGRLIAHHDGTVGRSLWQSLIGGGRWHSLSVFTTQEQRWVVYITYRTNVTGEVNNREVFWCEQAADLTAIFAQYQQVAFPVIATRIAGDPAAAQRAVFELQQRYHAQVAHILRRIPAATVRV